MGRVKWRAWRQWNKVIGGSRGIFGRIRPSRRQRCRRGREQSADGEWRVPNALCFSRVGRRIGYRERYGRRRGT